MFLTPDTRFIWTDIETSGLEVGYRAIFEIGFQVTDLDLHNIGEPFHALIWDDQHAQAIEDADDFVKDMHEKSGLFEEAARHGHWYSVVEASFNKWLDVVGVTRDDPLCGSSVHFDRAHLEHWFPVQMARFSYREINVSTLKELCRRKNPTMYATMEADTAPKKKHRVLPDIEDTIGEYGWYQDNFLWVQ